MTGPHWPGFCLSLRLPGRWPFRDVAGPTPQIGATDREELTEMQLKPVSYAMIAVFACGLVMTFVGSMNVILGGM